MKENLSNIHWNEEKLTQGLINEDRDAIKYFYVTYRGMILTLILSKSGTIEDMEDIFNECLVELIEKLKKGVRFNCLLSTYFYGMCKNQWQKRWTRKLKIRSLPDGYDAIDEVDGFFEVNEMIIERQRVIAELIKGLGESCKKVLLLYYFEGLNMNMIAERLGYTNADNAKNQKYKCMQKLIKLAHAVPHIKDIPR